MLLRARIAGKLWKSLKGLQEMENMEFMLFVASVSVLNQFSST